mmetsp:Transcript_128695/g.321058  ORF Transcript_128695/g.321058 Transcript_128695/m.321058 type:complete len:103 (-) Transcript_128695:1161-1469(-)
MLLRFSDIALELAQRSPHFVDMDLVLLETALDGESKVGESGPTSTATAVGPTGSGEDGLASAVMVVINSFGWVTIGAAGSIAVLFGEETNNSLLEPGTSFFL